MTIKEVFKERTERKNLYMLCVNFRTGKNIIEQKFKIKTVYKGKLKVCKHNQDFWRFNFLDETLLWLSALNNWAFPVESTRI